MTQDFVENGVNVYGGALDATPSEALSGVHFRSYKVPKPSTEVGWELRIDDLTAGYGQNEDYYGTTLSVGGLARAGFAKTSSSTLDSRWRRHLILPGLKATTNFAGSGTTCFATVFNTLVIASMADGGAGARTLQKETAAGVLTAITYDPPGNIYALSPIIHNGASSAAELCIMGLAAPRTLTDLTTGGPTAGTTGHANLANCFGMVQSPINATTPGTGTNLFYANSGIWSQPITAAISAAPTQVLSNIRNGGWSMGIEQLPQNLPLRWFLAIPKVDPGSGAGTGIAMRSSGAPAAVDIVHLNLEGSDPQTIPFSLTNIVFACLWQRNLVATDGLQIKAFDGDKERDLHFLQGRAANSDVQIACQALIVNGRDLYAVVAYTDLLTAGAVGASYYQIEMYDSSKNAWLVVSDKILPTFMLSAPNNIVYTLGHELIEWCSPSAPVSRQTGYCYIPTAASSGDDFQGFFLQPSLINPFERYRQTGSSAFISKVYTASGVWTSPYWQLPDLDGVPKCIDEIVFEGDVDAGGTAASVVVTAGDSVSTMTATFQTGLAHLRQIVSNPDKSTRFYELQVAITLTRDSTTTKTPNGLPIVIRGRAFPEATSTTTLSRDRRGR